MTKTTPFSLNMKKHHHDMIEVLTWTLKIRNKTDVIRLAIEKLYEAHQPKETPPSLDDNYGNPPIIDDTSI